MSKQKFKKGQKHVPVTEQPEEVKKETKSGNWPVYGIIIALAFLVYGNTIYNEYALDDAIVITSNQFTKKGFDGIGDILSNELFTGFFGVQKNLVMGGRYRPLSVVTFAVEYELFGENPHISHLLNICFFALTCIVLYLVLCRLLVRFQVQKWYLSLPFIATLLYVVHPLHTEVVSNIKGRDEIFTLLGALLATLWTLKYLDTKNLKYMAFGFLAFFLALASKENAVTFLVIIPVAVYFFTDHKLSKTVIPLAILATATVLFVILRQAVIGTTSTNIPAELMNDSFMEMTKSNKFAAITLTLGYYIRLLFFPHPLSFDYYPYMIPRDISWSNIWVILSLFAYILLGVYAIIKLKKKDVVAFGIIFFIVTFSPTSNIVFPIGTFMSERFMYMPSIGFCLIIAYLVLFTLPKYIKNAKTSLNASYAILFVALFLLSFKTISRNIDWKNDFFLFTHDVTVSGASAKSNCSAGGKLTEEAGYLSNIINHKSETKEQLLDELKQTDMTNSEIEEILRPATIEEVFANIENKRKELLKQAIVYLNRSVVIHPVYADALLLLGNAYWEYDRDIDSTVYCYKKILVQNCDYEKVHTNLFYSKIASVFTIPDSVNHNIRILEQLHKMCPNRFEINYQLGVQYGRFKNDLKMAIPYLEIAVKIDPKKLEGYKDLGVAYGMSGNFEKSAEMLEIAQKLDPKDPQLLINLATTYLNRNIKDKAFEYMDKVFKMEVKDAQVFVGLANIYRQAGNLEKSELAKKKAKELNPNIQLPF